MTGRLIRLLRALRPDASGPVGSRLVGGLPDPALLAGTAALLGHHTFRNDGAACPRPERP